MRPSRSREILLGRLGLSSAPDNSFDLTWILAGGQISEDFFFDPGLHNTFGFFTYLL
jgi:hypothetical protein